MSIGEIDARELQALLQSEDLYACIDVRERGEFALEQIAGTIPLARGTLELRVRDMIPVLAIPTVVCCDDGRRSALAARTLERMGYVNVEVLRGGLAGWRAQGRRTIEGWGVHGKRYGEHVAEDAAVPQITAEELAARRGIDSDLLVIDVRTEEEFLRGHVPGAFHVPGGQLPLEIDALAPDPARPIVVSCAGRTRGILGAHCLRQSGYPNASALLNGAMGWRLAGHELETGWGNGRPTVKYGPPPVVQEATRRLARDEEVRTLSAADFASLRQSGAPYYVVDVRLPAEYRAGHIPGSVSLPSGQLALMFENYLAVRQATVVVVADDAIRPIWAAALCQDLGFPRVFVLDGGLEGWTAGGGTLEVGVPAQPVHGLEAACREIPGLAAADLQRRMASDSAPVVLDVRSSGDFVLGHIPGARWLARGKLELGIEAVVPDRSRPIVTVCDTSVRSTLAAETLRALGRAEALYLTNGIASWREAGLPLVEGLDGADVTREEAQSDFGSTLFSGPLARTPADMERYLTWEEALTRQ